jgi:hydroxymethylpyrimidine pyrophosphatase-like HAD family hydrolase
VDSFGQVPVRIVYTDIDGTMVGARGSFFRTGSGEVDLEPARALTELLTAGVPLVLVSGRTRAQLVEACGIFGADGYIAELGAVVGWRPGYQSELLRGAMPEHLDAVPDELVDALLHRYAGRLEFHTPWHVGHEIDVLLRGQVDMGEVTQWLAEQGYGWLQLRDNGLLSSSSESLRTSGLKVSALHIYHLVPDGISKGLAVGRDLQRRGLELGDALAIGDSASDLEMAPYVGSFSVVANGARSPRMAELIAAHENVRVEDDGHGRGWATAIRRALS